MNYVLLSQKSHVEFFLWHMLSLGVTLPLDFLPIPKKEEVVSHPERACATGRTLHVISEREEHSS
jgi:hypothetical protein